MLLAVWEVEMPMKVKDLMSPDVETLFDDETMDLANTVMTLGRIRHLPVTDHQGRLLGLVTHRDLLRAFAELYRDRGPNMDEALVRVREIMTTEVRTIGPDDLALTAAELLWENKFGCLPVVQDQQVVGIVTEADFVRTAIRTLSDPGQ